MENGNGKEIFGIRYTFAVVVRGELGDIDKLILFLKASNLTVAHQQLGQNKMWIQEQGDDDD